MADIHPFHGVRYNQSQVNDLSAIICPPYDITTPQMQQELHERSKYNVVRLEFARELPDDTGINNKYTRSAETLEHWLKQGILRIDKTPAIYLHDHYFTYQGKTYRRRCITVTVRLEEWSRMVIRPHEGTLSEPKGDRLNLLWALQANTSPIFALFEDPDKQVASLLVAQEQFEPIINLNTTDGENHIIRAITETEAINQIRTSLAQQPLYIADGHHRYESALTYQRERRACSPTALKKDEPFDFVMMTLVDFSDPGLVILPAHRLVRGIAETTPDELQGKLKTFFAIKEAPLNMADIRQQVEDLLAGEGNESKLALFGLTKKHISVLTLRDFAAASQLMPAFHSELYRRLPVSLVDHVILEKLLGLGRDKEGVSLAYSYDAGDAVQKVLEQEYQLACLLKPTKAETVKAIADAGDRMPRKSTYFYPKLPTGLVFRRLE